MPTAMGVAGVAMASNLSESTGIGDLDGEQNSEVDGI